MIGTIKSRKLVVKFVCGEHEHELVTHDTYDVNEMLREAFKVLTGLEEPVIVNSIRVTDFVITGFNKVEAKSYNVPWSLLSTATNPRNKK